VSLPLPSTVHVDTLVELTALYDPAVNVCVLRRFVDPEVRRFVIEALPEDTGRLVRVQAISPDLDGLFQISSDAAGARAFLDEIRLLAAVYADLVDASHLGVRLAVTRAPMCPRFHVDRVGVRLVCTYQGAGTEWLDHGVVDRARMGHAAGGQSDAESGLIRDGAQIQSLSPFEVGFFKGEAWQGNAGRGAVHRSPAGGERRVVLTLEAL
jgi:hypothetical protein